MSSQLASDIQALYSVRDHHLLPFVGDGYVQPLETDLRMMIVGINSYISPKHWPPKPVWFGAWFSQPKFTFSRGARKALHDVAASLTASPLFQGLAYRDPATAYATNAIKIYMPEALGKKAHQISSAEFEQSLPQWRAELDFMAANHVLPHVIVVLGKPFWPYASQTFTEPPASWKHMTVISQAGAPEGHARLFSVSGGFGSQQMLLLRLAHPAAPRGKAKAKWLVSQPDFRELIGL